MAPLTEYAHEVLPTTIPHSDILPFRHGALGFFEYLCRDLVQHVHPVTDSVQSWPRQGVYNSALKARGTPGEEYMLDSVSCDSNSTCIDGTTFKFGFRQSTASY